MSGDGAGRRSVLLWPAAVVVAGCLAAGLAAWWQRGSNEALADTQLQALAQRAQERVTRRMRLYEYGLRGARSAVLVAGNEVETLSREHFQRFARSQDVLHQYPGIVAFAFVRRVPPGAEGAFLAGMRQEGFANIHIHQNQPHAGDRFVVQYIEPFEANNRAVGYDIASESRRREAVEQAIQRAQPTLTAPVTLVQTPGDPQQFVLLYLAAYRSVEPPQPAQRDAQAFGMVTASLAMDKVMRDLDDEDGAYAVALADATRPGAPQPLYTAPGWLGNADARVQSLPLDLYGRRWQLDVQALPDFEQRLNPRSPALVGSAIAASSLLLALLLGARLRAQQRERTIQLQRAQLAAVEHTALEQQVQRTRFMLALSESLRSLTDPDAMVAAVTAALCTQLQAAQASYGEFDETRARFRVLGESVAAGTCSRLGTWQLDDFGAAVAAELRAGHTVVMANVMQDPRAGEPAVAAAYQGIGVLGVLAVPLVKLGRLVALLAVHHPQPRPWSDTDVTLAQAACEQLWSALERARAQQSLARSEARLRAVLDALPVGVVIADAQGRLLQENTAHQALWGMQPQATSWEQYGEWVGFWPDTGQRIAAHEWAMARALCQGEVVRDELVECQPFGGGPRRFYLNNAAPVRDAAGQIIGGVVVEFDITQRLQAQEQLRQSRELFATAFANNPAAIVLSRLDDGTVLDVNDTWLRLVGEASREAVIGKPLTNLLSHADEHRRFVEQLQRTGTLQDWEQELRRENGEPIFVQVSAQILAMQGEKTILSTLVDITERKRTQEQLQALNATLEQRVARRTTELAAARDAAEAASRAKSAFLAHMSHELRTPLNAVIGLSQLLRRRSLPEDVGRFVDHIHDAGEQLLALVTDVLDLSRIEAGEMRLELAPFEPLPLVDAVLSMVKPQADAKGLALVADVAPDVPQHLLGDALRLRQVLLNLLSNAVKFTSAGSVTLRITAPLRDGQRVTLRLEVIDTGIGIAAEHQRRIFEPFTQADGSITRRFGGSGLGLSIVQRLVTMMDGTLSVQSQPGQGTAFTVELPFTTA